MQSRRERIERFNLALDDHPRNNMLSAVPREGTEMWQRGVRGRETVRRNERGKARARVLFCELLFAISNSFQRADKHRNIQCRDTSRSNVVVVVLAWNIDGGSEHAARKERKRQIRQCMYEHLSNRLELSKIKTRNVMA